MLKRSVSVVAALLFALAAAAPANSSENFDIEPFTPNDFYVFVKVFSEMRGPLRSEILKDRKTDFENADPLKYVEKVRDKRDVKKALKESDIKWEDFRELMGNVLLAYFSIQPDSTKAGIIKQLASYDLFLESDQIPPEYRKLVSDIVKTDAGAALAGMALEAFIQVPEQNVAIVKEKKKDLDRLFYTKYWAAELK